MNRHKFHDVACQGNLKFCQGIVREMSENFVFAGVWQPCWGLQPIIVCSNDDPGVTLTYFTAKTNLVT